MGQRSGTRPFLGFVVSQNQRKVRISTVSRNGSVRKSDAGRATAVVPLRSQANVSAAMSPSIEDKSPLMRVNCLTAIARGTVRLWIANDPTFRIASSWIYEGQLERRVDGMRTSYR